MLRSICIVLVFGFGLSQGFSSPLRDNEGHAQDDLGLYAVDWKTDGLTITFNISTKTTGYVGIGISPTASMQGADIFIWGVHPMELHMLGYVKSNKCIKRTSFAYWFVFLISGLFCILPRNAETWWATGLGIDLCSWKWNAHRVLRDETSSCKRGIPSRHGYYSKSSCA